MAEIIAETLLREHLSKCIENNGMFLDQPFWVANTGSPNTPVRIFPSDMAQDAQVIIKVVNDKDFRPQRNKDLLTFIQVVSSIRSQITPQTIGLLLPFIQEFARGVQVDPASIVKSLMATNPGQGGAPGGPQEPQGQPGGAMDQAVSGVQAAEAMRSQAGGLGQASMAMAGA